MHNSGYNETANDTRRRLDLRGLTLRRLEFGDLPYVAVFNNPLWYEYSTKRFTGWFNADNPVARPVVYGGVPERVLHLLALRPVTN